MIVVIRVYVPLPCLAPLSSSLVPAKIATRSCTAGCECRSKPGRQLQASVCLRGLGQIQTMEGVDVAPVSGPTLRQTCIRRFGKGSIPRLKDVSTAHDSLFLSEHRGREPRSAARCIKRTRSKPFVLTCEESAKHRLKIFDPRHKASAHRAFQCSAGEEAYRGTSTYPSSTSLSLCASALTLLLCAFKLVCS